MTGFHKILNHLFIGLFITLFLASCNKEENENNTIFPNSNKAYSYLYLGHPRTESVYNLDPIVEALDFTQFDMLWLGGDLTAATSKHDSILENMESIFNISSPNTLWSLGNHDNYYKFNTTEHTNRLPYYTYYKNGITFLVFDTKDRDSLSNIVNEQLELFNNVTDTITESKHLVILTHKLIWLDGNPALESYVDNVPNGGPDTCHYCLNPNNFYTDLYPKLKGIKANGINVICIAGDLGKKVLDFEYVTPEGVHFLASGIKGNSPGNTVLIFEQEHSSQALSWKFIDIETLKRK
jgi:hypothetical protein